MGMGHAVALAAALTEDYLYSENGKLFTYNMGGYYELKDKDIEKLPKFTITKKVIDKLATYSQDIETLKVTKTQIGTKWRGVELFFPLTQLDSDPVDEAILKPLMLHTYKANLSASMLFNFSEALRHSIDHLETELVTMSVYKDVITFTTKNSDAFVRQSFTTTDAELPSEWSCDYVASAFVKASMNGKYPSNYNATLTFMDNTKSALSSLLIESQIGVRSVLSPVW